MTQEKWSAIIKTYKAGQTQPFEEKIMPLYKKSKGLLFNIEGLNSEEDAWLVFSDSLVKFRQLFLIGSEPIPNNVNGFLYTAQKNIWIDICRKRNRKRQVKLNMMDKTQLEYVCAGSTALALRSVYSYQEEQVLESKRLHALDRAIGKLCDNCRKIIEEHALEGKKLKVLKEEMNYTTSSYQAIVEKKKRCMKKLTKLFFMELNQV